MKPRTAMLVALACLVLLFAQRAARANTPPPPFSCKNIPVYPAAVVFAEYPHFFYYCKNQKDEVEPKDAFPADIPIYLRNGSTLRIVVMHLNPLSQQVSVLIGPRQQYPELDSSVLKSIFNASLTSNTASPTKPSPAGGGAPLAAKDALQLHALNQLDEHLSVESVQSTCDSTERQIQSQMTTLETNVDALTAAANDYNEGSKELQDKFVQVVSDLAATEVAEQSSFTSQVQALGQVQTTPPNFKSTDASLNGRDLATVIDLIKSQATELYGSRASSLQPACQTQYKTDIANDQAYLKSIFSTTGATTSLADTLNAELDAANTLRATLATEKTTLLTLVSNPENYMYITAIPPEDRIQDQVLITVNVQPRSVTAAPAAAPAAGGSKKSPGKTPVAATAAPALAANSTSFTISFGAGPYAFESAGMVFTPLPQHSFATATTTTTAGQACSVSTTTGTSGNYCIVDNAASGWRILPMAVVSARYWTLDSSNNRAQFLLPNYLSAGATIKSNSSAGSSTSLEYLLGFSWAIPVVSPYHSPNLFATVGAYAGEVTQLGGGLKLGVQNGTAPTTLPTSSAYKWKLGFAVTYAFGSQGGNAKPAKTSTNGKAQPASDPAPAANQ